MEVIQLRKKSVVELEINGEEFIATLDNYSIDHFQKTNKIGLLKFYENLNKAQETGRVDLTQILQLLGSLIRYKKTNKPVGVNFLNQFETMEVINMLTPVLNKVMGANLPKATDEEEKK